MTKKSSKEDGPREYDVEEWDSSPRVRSWVRFGARFQRSYFGFPEYGKLMSLADARRLCDLCRAYGHRMRIVRETFEVAEKKGEWRGRVFDVEGYSGGEWHSLLIFDRWFLNLPSWPKKLTWREAKRFRNSCQSFGHEPVRIIAKTKEVIAEPREKDKERRLR